MEIEFPFRDIKVVLLYAGCGCECDTHKDARAYWQAKAVVGRGDVDVESNDSFRRP